MGKNKMIKENLTITKEDSTLAKLTKFCVWLSIVLCFMLFASTWLIFFLIFGFPTCFYLLCRTIHKARIQRKQHYIARKEITDNEIF